jgi:hypothetical protein
LKDAESGGFAENAGPFFGGELDGASLQLQGVRAVDAVQWAAVSEFSDEGQRIGRRFDHSDFLKH